MGCLTWVRPPSLPLNFLQIGILCCRIGRQPGADYTHFRDTTRKHPKRPDMRWPGDDFKPIQGEFKLTAKAAREYTE